MLNEQNDVLPRSQLPAVSMSSVRVLILCDKPQETRMPPVAVCQLTVSYRA